MKNPGEPKLPRLCPEDKKSRPRAAKRPPSVSGLSESTCSGPGASAWESRSSVSGSCALALIVIPRAWFGNVENERRRARCCSAARYRSPHVWPSLRIKRRQRFSSLSCWMRCSMSSAGIRSTLRMCSCVCRSASACSSSRSRWSLRRLRNTRQRSTTNLIMRCSFSAREHTHIWRERQ